jgi:hypothetical protein
MKQVPPEAPGVDNDLKDKVEDAAVTAMDQAGSLTCFSVSRRQAAGVLLQPPVANVRHG